MTDNKDVTSSMEPIQVSVVGGTGTGTGSGLVETPAGQPNIAIRIITPIVAILVRFAHTFGITLVGLLTAAMTPLGENVLQPMAFADLVMACARLSVAGASVGAIKDIVTIFGKLEGKFPLLTGGV